MKNSRMRTASAIITLALIGSMNAFVAFGNLKVSLDNPKVYSTLEETRTPVYGRIASMTDEEKMWIFPKEPFTAISGDIKMIDTSDADPSSVVEVDASGGSFTDYVNVFSGSDEIHDLVSYSTPPQYPYNFAVLINDGIYTAGMESNFDNSNPSQVDKLRDMTMITDLSLSFTNPRCLEVQLNSGGAFLIYGSGGSDGPRMMNIRYGIDEIRREDGNFVTSIPPVDDVRGEVTWPLQVLIGLYDAPFSPFVGNMVLGAAPGGQGALSTMSLQDIGRDTNGGTAPNPTSLLNVGAAITDMIQSTLFIDKIITAHSGGANILSIADINQNVVTDVVAKIDDTLNHIYYRGLIHPFGTSVYFALVQDDAAAPTASGLYYLDYSQEEETSNLAMMEIEGLPDGIWADFALFRGQGYLALVGQNTGATADVYTKVQVLCHSSCDACDGITDSDCTRCPEGITLSSGKCPVDEIELTADDMVADCGGVNIPLCQVCEEDFIGFCQECQVGSRLGELNERATSEQCVRCLPNCKICEENERGKYFSFYFLRSYKMSGLHVWI